VAYHYYYYKCTHYSDTVTKKDAGTLYTVGVDTKNINQKADAWQQ